VRKLLDGDLRLRTACDLEPIDRENVVALRPKDFKLPASSELEIAVKKEIAACKELMTHTTVTFEDELRKGKEVEADGDDGGDDADVDATSNE